MKERILKVYKNIDYYYGSQAILSTIIFAAVAVSVGLLVVSFLVWNFSGSHARFLGLSAVVIIISFVYLERMVNDLD